MMEVKYLKIQIIFSSNSIIYILISNILLKLFLMMLNIFINNFKLDKKNFIYPIYLIINSND